jgi:spermidine synthase
MSAVAAETPRVRPRGTETSFAETPGNTEANRRLVFALFFASGISGLMYQVVWLRMLARIMGVTIHATSAVLAAFMGGLALGSFLLGRYIDRRKDPLRVYAVLELAIGVAALIVPLVLMGAAPLYASLYGSIGGSASSVVRIVFAVATLLIPTTLMGGTLPVLTTYLTRSQLSFGKSFSKLYGLNTFGAVVGVLASGFITIGVLGEWWTVIIGALLNFVVAFIALRVFSREQAVEQTSGSKEAQNDLRISFYSDTVRRVVLIAFALSGFTALAYEVIWTRQLILFLRTSIYAFSGMLAVFLTGVALGSLVMNKIVDKLRTPLFTFALLELAIAVISLVNLHLFKPLDSPFAHEMLGWSNVAYATILVVLPLTFMFGMIAPVALVCFAKSVSKAGTSVGGLYSANTFGNILGAVLAGFLLVPKYGGTQTVLYLALGNAAIGLVLLALESGRSWTSRLTWSAVSLPAIVFLGVSISGKDPFRSAIEQRIDMRMGTTWMPDSNRVLPHSQTIYYHKEGIEGTVTAFDINRFKQLWVNGMGMTFLTTQTKLMAYLPLAMTKEPKQFLAIAFGMGTTVRSAARLEEGLYPGLQITAVDLIPQTFETYKYYHRDAEEIKAKSNVHLLVNDGRNHLLVDPTLYDVITVDPAPPIYSAGTVNLYTREFFELSKSRLTPTGVFCLWFPGGTKQEVHSLLKTFNTVFPEAAVFSGTFGWGYFLIGANSKIDWDHFNKQLALGYEVPVTLKDLHEWDLSAGDTAAVHKMLMWRNSEIMQAAKTGVLITDNYPFTEFPLWRYLKGGRGLWHPRSTWLPDEQRQ